MLQCTETLVGGRPCRREIDFGCPLKVVGKTAQYVLSGDQHHVSPDPTYESLSGDVAAGDGFAQTLQETLQVRHSFPEFPNLVANIL